MGNTIQRTTTTYRRFWERDSRSGCNCPMPLVLLKGSRVLGRCIEVRYCCMAAALRKLGFNDVMTVFEVPTDEVWDSNALVEAPDGTKVRRGDPPQWMQTRMREKGIKWRS